MNVLSLFDGISCARRSIDIANIPVKNYYGSEIEKNAIFISKKNYPSIIRLGTVVDIKIGHPSYPTENIDLLIGGSPCQDLSIAKKGRKGLDGERSGLFWEYVRIMKEIKPTWFILENVASMSDKDRDIISEAMGCQPVMFNASLVSAQSRKRLFWTNIKFELPVDRGIILKNILEPDGLGVIDQQYTLTETKTGLMGKVVSGMIKVGHIGKSDGQGNRVYSPEGKSCTLSANGGGGGAKTGLYNISQHIRKLTPIECERLQSLPDNYTQGVATTNRYKCLGNAFNCEVIAHILSFIR